MAKSKVFYVEFKLQPRLKWAKWIISLEVILMVVALGYLNSSRLPYLWDNIKFTWLFIQTILRSL